MTDAAETLHDAARERERARERVVADGEDALRRCQEVYRELVELFERYEDSATGSGDFQAFTQFQGTVASLTDDLDEELPERERFEDVDDYLQQRRLTEDDFETARRKLDPVGERVAAIEEWEQARTGYTEARRNAQRRLGEIDDEIAALERLQRLGEADLDAPVDRLKAPIEAYDDAVREAFREFRRETPAREVLSVIERTELFPLVEFQPPPAELLDYVRTHEAGTETIPRLLEYADYSASKLDHYVEDTAALRRTLPTQRTSLRNLDAEPLTVGWPPPPADHLPCLCREYRAVLAGFADESVVARLRDVRDLADDESYDRLRESALARAELTADERERLASGAVSDELDELREKRAAIEDALEDHGPLEN